MEITRNPWLGTSYNERFEKFKLKFFFRKKYSFDIFRFLGDGEGIFDNIVMFIIFVSGFLAFHNSVNWSIFWDIGKIKYHLTNESICYLLIMSIFIYFMIKKGLSYKIIPKKGFENLDDEETIFVSYHFNSKKFKKKFKKKLKNGRK